MGAWEKIYSSLFGSTNNAIGGFTTTQKRQSNVVFSIEDSIAYWPELSDSELPVYVLRKLFLIKNEKGITVCITNDKKLADKILQWLNETTNEKHHSKVRSVRKRVVRDSARGTL